MAARLSERREASKSFEIIRFFGLLCCAESSAKSWVLSLPSNHKKRSPLSFLDIERRCLANKRFVLIQKFSDAEQSLMGTIRTIFDNDVQMVYFSLPNYSNKFYSMILTSERSIQSPVDNTVLSVSCPHLHVLGNASGLWWISSDGTLFNRKIWVSYETCW